MAMAGNYGPVEGVGGMPLAPGPYVALDGSMMGPPESSLGGMSPPYDPHAAGGSVMQGQYPTGAAMGTFNGGGHGGGGGGEAHGGGGHAPSAHGHDEEHGSEHGHHATIEKETGIAPRRCTDIQCCFAWLVFTVLLATMGYMARWRGNVEALTHGRDYYGRICGVSQGVENMPWLFWCRNDAPSALMPQALQLTNPSCVAACPVSANTNMSALIPCLRPAESSQFLVPTQQFGNEITQEVEMQESVIYTVAYPTRPRGGRFCIPTEEKLETQLMESWDALHPLGNIMRMVTAGTLGHLEWIFAVVVVVGVLMGYFFYFVIKSCPKTLTNIFIYPAALLCLTTAVWLFFAIFVLIPGSSGWEWVVNYKNKWNPLYQHYTVQFASWLSIGACAFSLFVMISLVGIDQNFDAAQVADLINAAMGCMNAVPGMYYIPLFEAIIKWAIFIFFLNGLRWFFTVGDLHKNRIHVNGAQFAGLSREWSWDGWWTFCVVGWVVGFYWFMELANTFFEYMISKATISWYFTPKEGGKKKIQGSPLKDGLKDAILYHWGSIAYGAFWIPWWRPLRLTYWTVSSIVPGRGGDSFLGKVLGCCDTICCCGAWKDCFGLKSCTKEKVESNDALIKDAFSDIVIRANDFGAASEKAHMLLEHSHRVVQYMYRDQSQTTLCILGVSGIATVCSWVTFMITNFAKIFTVPSSGLYIANPGLVIFLSWVLGAYIAFGFMSAWDHTADTLLYCYAWNRKFDRKSVEKFIPQSVRDIVGNDDKEDDRYPYYGRAKTNMYLQSWISLPKSKAGAKKKEEKPPAKPETPPPSWVAQRSWMSNQPPPAGGAPGGQQEMQSLLQKDPHH